MSSLSKLSIPKIRKDQLWLRIDRIHPDAQPLNWLLEQDLKTLKVMSIFRVMLVLEAHKKQESPLYQLIYNRLNGSFGGELKALSPYTELSEDGTWPLEEVIDALVSEAEVVEQDFNDNWENGKLNDLNPHEMEQFAVPYLVVCLRFTEPAMSLDLQDLYHFTALSISCTE